MNRKVRAGVGITIIVVTFVCNVAFLSGIDRKKLYRDNLKDKTVDRIVDLKEVTEKSEGILKERMVKRTKRMDDLKHIYGEDREGEEDEKTSPVSNRDNVVVKKNEKGEEEVWVDERYRMYQGEDKNIYVFDDKEKKTYLYVPETQELKLVEDAKEPLGQK